MALITKQEVSELIEQLETHRGRATELITVYIPEGQNIYTVANQLDAEKSTAKNIKSTGTRKNVSNALDKITRELKDYKKTPENGLAIFCGNVSKVEGQDDLQIWIVEPPMPLKTRMYRCDKEFVLEPLKEMIEIDEIFGLLVMDRKEATIGVLEGKRVEMLQKMTSGIPSKVRAGGQSSQRFHRITEGLTKEFYKRIAEEMKKIFLGNKKLKGIIIGGPIPTKDEFVDGEYLATELRQKILGKVDIGDTSESGLEELVEKSQDLLASHERVEEKKVVERLFKNLGEKPDMTFIKEADILRALEAGAVETLFLSNDTEKGKAKNLTAMAHDIGSEVKIISSETPEGDQFLNLGGLAAILRFKI